MVEFAQYREGRYRGGWERGEPCVQFARNVEEVGYLEVGFMLVSEEKCAQFQWGDLRVPVNQMMLIIFSKSATNAAWDVG